MIYGLYLSAQGAQSQSVRMDVTANNLANASTTAFKRDLAVFQAHRPFDVENEIAAEIPGGLNESTGGISVADVETDFSDGSLIKTDGMYDIALAGPGFLQVTDGNQEFLTRNGKLAVNDNGELVTQDGQYRVMGPGGARIVLVQNSGEIEIGHDGSINEFDDSGARIKGPKLAIVRPESFEDLHKVGNGLYRTEGKVVSAVDVTKVQQGYVENSGTRSVFEMMEMIDASRSFETNINMIRYQDEALGQLLQSVGRR